MAGESLDETLDGILDEFLEDHRLDRAHERLRESLRLRLTARGAAPEMLQLLEVNLFGSLSGWMDFLIAEHRAGRDAVPSFARHLKHAFLAHCREHTTPPEDAVRIALELANAIMDIAIAFRRHLNLPENGGPLPMPPAP